MDYTPFNYINKALKVCALVLLASCAGDDDEGRDERVPLRITSSIQMEAQGITRATNSAWEAGDRIGVFVTTHNTTTLYSLGGGNVCRNLPYTFDDGTNYETGGTTYRNFDGGDVTIYLPTAPSALDVYGYYPYNNTYTDPTAIPVNVATQTIQQNIDLMRALHDNRNKTNNTAQLLFYHRLVKLIFNLKRASFMLPAEMETTTLSIGGQPTMGSYNVYTDRLAIPTPLVTTSLTAVRTATPTTGYDLTLEVIVMPNTGSHPAADRTVTIAIAGTNYTFTIGHETTFDAGTKYVYNVTVNAMNLQVDPDKYTEQW